jgi:D-glycero-alpha-D-manno-heptose 1-phosphate guanylyltransferase
MKDALILAGGLGTRLQSVVSDRPKPMAPINGRPFLEILIAHLQAAGIERVTLALGHMAHVVVEYFSSRALGIEISYVIESQPLGTGGAIANGLRGISAERVLVVNGDTFIDFPYAKLEQKEAPICMAVAQIEDTARYGRVLLSDTGSVTGFVEKGTAGSGLINAGIYLIRPSALELPGDGRAFSFETEILQVEAGRGNVQAVAGGRMFIDIGVPEDYLRAQDVLKNYQP